MKSKIILLLINSFFCITISAQTLPYVVSNITGGNLNIRSGSPCTSATIATTLAQGKKLVGSAITIGSCSNDWFTVDIPLTSTPTTVYYGSKGSGFLECDATTAYVQVYNTSGLGLFVRTNAGSGNVTIGGINAKIWDNQKFATTGNTSIYGGYTWYEIYLTNNCSQTTGWVSGQYLTYHNGQSCSITCSTPGTPTNVIGTSTGQTTASLSWSSGSPTGSPTINYYWTVGTSPSVTYGNGVANGFTTNTSTTVSNLTCNTTYYLRVFASTSCDNSQSSIGTSSSFTTSACQNTGLYGVDIYAGNGVVNWSTVYQAGKSFAYVKATKGDGISNSNCYVDSKFYTNMTSSNPNNIILGAYHFALPEDNPGISGATAEANYFYNAAQSYIGNGYLPPALDLEDPQGTCVINSVGLETYYNGNYITLAQWVQNWCNRIYSLSGKWPVLYVTKCMASTLFPYYQNGTINNNIKLWIATNNITTDPPESPNTNYSCGGNTSWNGWPWLFHQYFFPSSAGNNPTTYASPGMDQNYFNGTIADLQNLTMNVETNNINNVFVIYPNPFEKYILIQSSDNKTVDLKIFDINGRILGSEKVNIDYEYKYDLEFLSSGIYILEVTSNEKINTFKIIKK